RWESQLDSFSGGCESSFVGTRHAVPLHSTSASSGDSIRCQRAQGAASHERRERPVCPFAAKQIRGSHLILQIDRRTGNNHTSKDTRRSQPAKASPARRYTTKPAR